MTAKQRVLVTPEEFVKAWQASKDMAEVAKKTGMKLESVRARGHRFRKHGVPLKKFASQGRPVTDWAALKKLAQELTPKG
jgi:hypothetical protein